jgi:hypothetical protein
MALSHVKILCADLIRASGR